MATTKYRVAPFVYTLTNFHLHKNLICSRWTVLDFAFWTATIKSDYSTMKFQEVQGGLFSDPSATSLAHCVSTDMSLSKGIATQFRDQFGRVDDLKRQ
ncbi:unnamed protein product, partial [Rotaria sp. Silwood1]